MPKKKYGVRRLGAELFPEEESPHEMSEYELCDDDDDVQITEEEYALMRDMEDRKIADEQAKIDREMYSKAKRGDIVLPWPPMDKRSAMWKSMTREEKKEYLSRKLRITPAASREAVVIYKRRRMDEEREREEQFDQWTREMLKKELVILPPPVIEPAPAVHPMAAAQQGKVHTRYTGKKLPEAVKVQMQLNAYAQERHTPRSLRIEPEDMPDPMNDAMEVTQKIRLEVKYQFVKEKNVHGDLVAQENRRRELMTLVKMRCDTRHIVHGVQHTRGPDKGSNVIRQSRAEEEERTIRTVTVQPVVIGIPLGMKDDYDISPITFHGSNMVEVHFSLSAQLVNYTVLKCGMTDVDFVDRRAAVHSEVQTDYLRAVDDIEDMINLRRDQALVSDMIGMYIAKFIRSLELSTEWNLRTRYFYCVMNRVSIERFIPEQYVDPMLLVDAIHASENDYEVTRLPLNPEYPLDHPCNMKVEQDGRRTVLTEKQAQAVGGSLTAKAVDCTYQIAIRFPLIRRGRRPSRTGGVVITVTTCTPTQHDLGTTLRMLAVISNEMVALSRLCEVGEADLEEIAGNRSRPQPPSTYLDPDSGKRYYKCQADPVHTPWYANEYTGPDVETLAKDVSLIRYPEYMPWVYYDKEGNILKLYDRQGEQLTRAGAPAVLGDPSQPIERWQWKLS